MQVVKVDPDARRARRLERTALRLARRQLDVLSAPLEIGWARLWRDVMATAKGGAR